MLRKQLASNEDVPFFCPGQYYQHRRAQPAGAGGTQVTVSVCQILELNALQGGKIQPARAVERDAACLGFAVIKQFRSRPNDPTGSLFVHNRLEDEVGLVSLADLGCRVETIICDDKNIVRVVDFDKDNGGSFMDQNSVCKFFAKTPFMPKSKLTAASVGSRPPQHWNASELESELEARGLPPVHHLNAALALLKAGVISDLLCMSIHVEEEHMREAKYETKSKLGAGSTRNLELNAGRPSSGIKKLGLGHSLSFRERRASHGIAHESASSLCAIPEDKARISLSWDHEVTSSSASEPKLTRLEEHTLAMHDARMAADPKSRSNLSTASYMDASTEVTMRSSSFTNGHPAAPGLRKFQSCRVPRQSNPASLLEKLTVGNDPGAHEDEDLQISSSLLRTGSMSSRRDSSVGQLVLAKPHSESNGHSFSARASCPQMDSFDTASVLGSKAGVPSQRGSPKQESGSIMGAVRRAFSMKKSPNMRRHSEDTQEEGMEVLQRSTSVHLNRRPSSSQHVVGVEEGAMVVQRTYSLSRRISAGSTSILGDSLDIVPRSSSITVPSARSPHSPDEGSGMEHAANSFETDSTTSARFHRVPSRSRSVVEGVISLGVTPSPPLTAPPSSAPFSRRPHTSNMKTAAGAGMAAAGGDASTLNTLLTHYEPSRQLLRHSSRNERAAATISI